jgi:hypothetical protein
LLETCCRQDAPDPALLTDNDERRLLAVLHLDTVFAIVALLIRRGSSTG